MRRMYSKPQLLEAVEQESKLNGIKVFEDIKDKDGHARFIEGPITMETVEGLTQTYGRWSLSGSHLMIVLCITAVTGTSLTSGTTLAKVNIPQWIKDKLVPMFSNYIEITTISIYGNDGTSQTMGIDVRKIDNELKINNGLTLSTLAKDRHVRVALDYIIDNE